MRKFRLPVRSQIFIAKTSRHLEIAVHSSYHEQLFEKLRGLGQGIELALMHPAGHQVVSGPFRRALGEEGGFHLDEAVLIQVFPDGFKDFISFLETILHGVTSKVEIPVLHPDLLIHVFRA